MRNVSIGHETDCGKTVYLPTDKSSLGHELAMASKIFTLELPRHKQTGGK